MESGSGAVPLLEDLRKISRENEGNTERLTNVLKQMFALISQDFKENRAKREADKERIQAQMVQVAVVVLLKMKLQVVLVHQTV